MLECGSDLYSIRKQSTLLKVNRSSIYYKPIISSDSEIANMIAEIYLSSDCRYGYRKVAAVLNSMNNMQFNHKKVLRLMQEMHLQGLYPRKKINTTTRNLVSVLT